MFIFYDLIFFIFAAVYLPVSLLRRKFHPGGFRRLGILPENLQLGCPIWIHSVSVGEMMAVKYLIEGIRKSYPDKKLVISTVTPTGNFIARNIAQTSDFVTYLPLDFGFIVKSVIDRVNPSLFIITETEFWPNLITYLYKKKVPIVSVNGRISDNSFKGYSVIKFLLKPILNKINLFCVRTGLDSQRLINLGVPQDKIKITGNMKFDIATNSTYAVERGRADKYKTFLGLDSRDRLWVSGSTHPKEEEIIISVYKELLNEFKELKLLIAPRHPERAKEIEEIVIKYGFKAAMVGQLTSYPVNQFNPATRQPANPQTHKPLNHPTVFILDTVGELMNYYSIADVVFVGGSLIKKGGHNILEPLSLCKAVLFGPYMFNFQDIRELALQKQAAILVYNAQDLQKNIKDLLDNPSKVEKMGKIAKNLILENQGATKRNLEYIKTLLMGR